eukprot:TRINITY_DN4582_c1_g1_i1.p1 TRINITY_DN4582_c1_g1~~TRINITY_DN4582_c1_g1_i1.p1  ORF type:complete len:815 (+),score=185.13 TRINITY_DN4582_c1_g1_i1:323-2446(+)
MRKVVHAAQLQQQHLPPRQRSSGLGGNARRSGRRAQSARLHSSGELSRLLSSTRSVALTDLTDRTVDTDGSSSRSNSSSSLDTVCNTTVTSVAPVATLMHLLAGVARDELCLRESALNAETRDRRGVYARAKAIWSAACGEQRQHLEAGERAVRWKQAHAATAALGHVARRAAIAPIADAARRGVAAAETRERGQLWERSAECVARGRREREQQDAAARDAVAREAQRLLMQQRQEKLEAEIRVLEGAERAARSAAEADAAASAGVLLRGCRGAARLLLAEHAERQQLLRELLRRRLARRARRPRETRGRAPPPPAPPLSPTPAALPSSAPAEASGAELLSGAELWLEHHRRCGCCPASGLCAARRRAGRCKGGNTLVGCAAAATLQARLRSVEEAAEQGRCAAGDAERAVRSALLEWERLRRAAVARGTLPAAVAERCESVADEADSHSAAALGAPPPPPPQRWRLRTSGLAIPLATGWGAPPERRKRAHRSAPPRRLRPRRRFDHHTAASAGRVRPRPQPGPETPARLSPVSAPPPPPVPQAESSLPVSQRATRAAAVARAAAAAAALRAPPNRQPAWRQRVHRAAGVPAWALRGSRPPAAAERSGVASPQRTPPPPPPPVLLPAAEDCALVVTPPAAHPKRPWSAGAVRPPPTPPPPPPLCWDRGSSVTGLHSRAPTEAQHPAAAWSPPPPPAALQYAGLAVEG